MRRLKERPTTELPAGLQQLLVLAHKNKDSKWYGNKIEVADAWFGATSTASNTEIYENWHRKVVAAKLKAIRRDPGREAATQGGIFRDRRVQTKSKNFRPRAQRRRSFGRKNGHLVADSSSDASSRDQEAENGAQEEDLTALLPAGFLATAPPNRLQDSQSDNS